MKKLYDGFTKALVTLVTFIYITMILCLIFQVFARYVLQIPTPWSEEIARYLLVLTTVIGAGEVSRRGDHLGVYFLRDRLQGRPKMALYIFNLIVQIVFMLVISLGIYQAYRLSGDVVANTMSWFKQRWLYAGLGFGNLMMLLYALRDLVESCVSFAQGVPIEPKDGFSAPFPRDALDNLEEE